MKVSAKRKRLFIVGCTLLAFALYSILGLLGILPFPIRMHFRSNEGDLTEAEQTEQMIKTTYPTDILIMGEEIPFGDEVSYRMVEDITEKALERKKGCSYTFLFVNDLNDSVQLTDDEIALLAASLETEAFCMVYLGEKYAAAWDKPDEPIVTVEGNLGYRYFMCGGLPRRVIGAWSTEEQELCQTHPDIFRQAMLYELQAYLLEVN